MGGNGCDRIDLGDTGWCPDHGQFGPVSRRLRPGSAPCVRQADGSCVPVGPAAPLPVAGKQESLVLAAANSAAAPQVVYGGAYVFGQACGSYNGGTLALRYRGPDGVAMLTLLTRGAAMRRAARRW
ncbi:hypothetical protein P0F65_12375 [Sphingomonas sp. I4]